MVACAIHGNFPCIQCLKNDIRRCEYENQQRIKTGEPLHDTEGLKRRLLELES